MTGSTGAWSWHHTGLVVRGVDETVEYYRTLLGFEVVFEARGMTDLISGMTGVKGLRADLIQCRSTLGDQVLEFIEFSGIPADVDHRLPVQPGRAHTAYLVPDLERAVWELERAGGEMLGQITEFSEGRAVYCADAHGTVIEWEEAKEPTT